MFPVSACLSAPGTTGLEDLSGVPGGSGSRQDDGRHRGPRRRLLRLLRADQSVKVATLVEADAAATDDCETEKTGTLLTYALIRPKSKGRVNRYLCYQARPVDGQWKMTILYLEGPATLSDLRSMFEKQ